MRRAQRSVRAHRQHPQRATRQVTARHRSADLPGQADGSHKPRAANAAPTPNHKRASASPSECSECSEISEISDCSLLPQPPRCLRSAMHREKERASASPSECSEISDRSTTPAAKAAHPLRHRSTRTLNPLADGAAAPRKSNFHHYTAQTTVEQSPRCYRGVPLARTPYILH